MHTKLSQYKISTIWWFLTCQVDRHLSHDCEKSHIPAWAQHGLEHSSVVSLSLTHYYPQARTHQFSIKGDRLAAVSWLSCCSPLINQSVMHCKCLKNVVVHAVCSSYIRGNRKRCDLTTGPNDYRCVCLPGPLLFSCRTFILRLFDLILNLKKKKKN